jgi:beta-phosphoglucomutase
MRAVIFDFDGVLVDSEPLHFEALRDALRAAEGLEVGRDEYYAKYLAFDDRGAIRRVLEDRSIAADAERIERIALQKAASFELVLRRVTFFPGARELVLGLAEEVPVGIASGALHGEIERILDAGRLRGAFSAIVGADDVSETKPDPAPYLEAARQLAAFQPGLLPSDCLAFEDSPPGIASALAAGLKVVGVANSYPPARLAAAHHVVPSLVGMGPASLRVLFAS